MSERQSMKPVLKDIGEGPYEIVTDRADLNIGTFQMPDGKMQAIPGPSLIAFTATSCREQGDSDVWEFRVPVQTQGGPAQSLIYLRGVDIYMIKMMSKVAA